MSSKLSTRIYNSIREGIVKGMISEQEFLTEKSLAEKYEVSKAPVRDALHLLCSQGYLVSYPRKGYMVSRYSQKDIQEMHQIRLPLEQLAVTLAIQNATDEEIESLRQFSKLTGDTPDPHQTNNTRFHLRLAEISGNSKLPIVLQELITKVSLYWIEVSNGGEYHEQIIDALLQRDLDAALQALEADLVKAC